MKEQTLAVQRMQDYIAEHLEEEITLAQLAEQSLFSPWHSYRLFRAYTGLSPAAYIRRLRLTRSARRLKDGSCRVTDAAYACGFSDPKYLNRSFQKNLGMTPRQWLLENRPDPSCAPSAEDPRTAQRILTPGECRALLDALEIP